jgi:translocation and assembly module TamB
LTADADWRGDRVTLQARLAGEAGQAITLSGTAPFAFDLATFKPRPTASATLALRLTGNGRIEQLAAAVPLGEDRLTGAFALDVAVGGTIAAPKPSSRITVTGGHYANMAMGTELDAVDLALSGVGERFVLDHLSATDGAAGRLTASGSVDLAATPAKVGLKLGLSDFLVARSDDATASADGNLSVDGTMAAAEATGQIKIRHAELYLPDRLPPNVVKLNVVDVGAQQPEDTAKSQPLAPVTLRIAVDAPGQVMVRGRGITSEWRGHVDISGTTAAPVLTGQLETVNGTANLLGKTFTIDRGNIGFLGSKHIDPTLDVSASVVTAGITAQLNVAGTASAPKIALSSVPALPQDEILSHVLFGQDASAITPSEGLQLAAAAASLAQGGPGVLDRVRNTIGLDRLDIGTASNPNGNQGVAKGTTIAGGKYIANGVYVGVKQGLSVGSSQAVVQYDITPNISVNSTVGAGSGSGFGASYKIDY